MATTVWSRFQLRHLPDYTGAATGLWLAIVVAGAAALLWSATQLLALPPDKLIWIAGGLALVILAGSFPIQIPRTQHTVLVADIFVFIMLATMGGPAAVLAAGVEALTGALRTSRRLSTWLSGPAAAMGAMAICQAVFAASQFALQSLGLSAAAAEILALCLAAPAYVTLTTGMLMNMISLKRGKPLSVAAWFEASTGIAAMTQGSALLAGLLALNARLFGLSLIAIAGGVVMSMVLLLRLTLARQEREQQAKDAVIVQAQKEVVVNQQRFMSAFTHAAIGMAVVNADGIILQANKSLAALAGKPERKLAGQPFVDLLHPGDVPLFCQLADGLAASQGSAFTLELRCLPQKGPLKWVSIHGSHFQEGLDAQSTEHCLIFQLHDVTARHLAESRLHHIAFHDSLTDLANRHCFNEMLQAAIARSQARPDKRFAVVFLDLDRFKVVNDSLGHQAGNLMLREVADRLKSSVRPDDVVARLGGDEFAILLEDLASQDQGIDLAQRALAAIGQPLSIYGTEVLPAGSMGITFSDRGYQSSEDVLRDADLAMYEAKGKGRGQVVVFDQIMHRRVAEKLSLEADLRRAIGDGQLSVDFQPIYKLDSFTLIGFEALARWTHPRRGPISPGVFIALAEESGHMGTLTDWVIDQSLQMLAQWQKSRPETANLVMHVNISSRDLGREGLVPAVQSALARHAPSFGSLTLEITETTLMGHKTSALKAMEELRRSGVRCSIDDFGTGYSSLAYLGSFPIDSLKIDRSFVTGLQDQAHNVEIVRAVLTLGNAMGRKVVAEGIETAEQLDILRQLGVPFGQGYLLSHPLRAGQIDPLIATNPPRRADATASPRMLFN